MDMYVIYWRGWDGLPHIKAMFLEKEEAERYAHHVMGFSADDADTLVHNAQYDDWYCDVVDVMYGLDEFLKPHYEEDDEPADIDDDCGFDPYEGCFTYDC